MSYTKYSSGLKFGEGLCIFTSFNFPASGLYLMNGFDFYFDLQRSRARHFLLEEQHENFVAVVTK